MIVEYQLHRHRTLVVTNHHANIVWSHAVCITYGGDIAAVRRRQRNGIGGSLCAPRADCAASHGAKYLHDQHRERDDPDGQDVRRPAIVGGWRGVQSSSPAMIGATDATT